MRAILLAISLALPAAGQAVYAYRLRGEVRLLLFWKGKDDVGGGRITVARDRIEVLFGSDPERIPGRINRWGYGLETAEWSTGPASRLLSTEFRGIMRHSTESSIDEAVSATQKAAASGQYLYDASLSKVLPESAWHEVRVLAEAEDFDYRRPDRLLASFQQALAGTPPARRGELTQHIGPYGFLTGLQELIRRVTERRARHSLTVVYNSRPYSLEVLDVRSVPESDVQDAWKAAGARDLAQIRFRSFNTVKRTRTDFELWVPTAGALQGIPVRIILQPRWWLRLRMDLTSASTPPSSGIALAPLAPRCPPLTYPCLLVCCSLRARAPRNSRREWRLALSPASWLREVWASRSTRLPSPNDTHWVHLSSGVSPSP